MQYFVFFIMITIAQGSYFYTFIFDFIRFVKVCQILIFYQIDRASL